MIISPEQRLAEAHGARFLFVGPNGVGKTSALRKLKSGTTLFVDIENGALAIAEVPVPHVRPETWPEVRDLVVRIAGPNRSFGSQEPYSQAHFDRVGGFLPDLEGYQTIFLTR
jgi:ABC-type branched-subunit amino acid transport system ATPase component